MDCLIDHNGQSTSYYGNGMTQSWHIGGRETGVNFAAVLGVTGKFLSRGVIYDANGNNFVAGWTTGCRINKVGSVQFRLTNSVVSNVALTNTELNDPQVVIVISNGGNPVDGLVVANNFGDWVKKIGADNGNASIWLQFGSDAGTKVMKNIMVWHNTLWGASNMGRWKLGYNDVAGQNLLHESISDIGNIGPALHAKGDRFANDPNNTGNWGIHLGVDGRANLFAYFSQAAPDSQGVRCDYYGMNSLRGSVVTTTDLRASAFDPKFVVDGSITASADNVYPGDGPGNGDLRLQAGSPCLGALSIAVLPFTVDGVARPLANDHMGAKSAA
jgi:hypothetical protein